MTSSSGNVEVRIANPYINGLINANLDGNTTPKPQHIRVSSNIGVTKVSLRQLKTAARNFSCDSGFDAASKALADKVKLNSKENFYRTPPVHLRTLTPVDVNVGFSSRTRVYKTSVDSKSNDTASPVPSKSVLCPSPVDVASFNSAFDRELSSEFDVKQRRSIILAAMKVLNIGSLVDPEINPVKLPPSLSEPAPSVEGRPTSVASKETEMLSLDLSKMGMFDRESIWSSSYQSPDQLVGFYRLLSDVIDQKCGRMVDGLNGWHYVDERSNYPRPTFILFLNDVKVLERFRNLANSDEIQDHSADPVMPAARIGDMIDFQISNRLILHVSPKYASINSDCAYVVLERIFGPAFAEKDRSDFLRSRPLLSRSDTYKLNFGEDAHLNELFPNLFKSDFTYKALCNQNLEDLLALKKLLKNLSGFGTH